MKRLAFAILSLSIYYAGFAQAPGDLTISLQSDEGIGFLVEDCETGTDTIVIQLTNPADSSLTFLVNLGGSATDGQDYSHGFSEQVTFDSGQATVKVPITILPDNIFEDTEVIDISVTDESGTLLARLSISLFDEFEIQIIPDVSSLSVCQGETVELRTMPSGLFTWTVDTSEVVDSVFTLRIDEDIKVTVTANVGSCTATDEVDITLTAGVSFMNGDTAFVCFPDDVLLSLSVIGDPNGNYIWSPLDTTLELMGQQSALVTTPETKTYTITFENAECTVSDTVVVRVDSLPDEIPIDVVPLKDDYCPGETVTLFSRYMSPFDFPDAEYEWQFDAGSPLSETDLQNLVFTTVDTSIFRRITDNNACSRVDSVLIIVINPPVDLSLTDTVVCPNQPVKVELLDPDELEEIMWMPEEGLSCTECPDPTIRTPVSATYTVQGKTKGCPASASVTVNIFPPDLITVIPDTVVCPGQEIQLTALEASEYEELRWTGSDLSCNNCDNPFASPSQNTFYLVGGEKDDGCTGQGGITVSTFQLPQAGIETEPQGPLEVGSGIQLSAVTGPDVSGTATFEWQYNGDPLNETGAVIDASILGESNTYTVIITTEEGCQIQTQVTVEGIPPRVEFPSAFTPGGDDLNDRFRPVIFGSATIREFKIFNRWGEVVYESTNSDGWDGRQNGKEAPSDVYAFMAIWEFPDGSVETRRGEVNLIR
ncbi:MAG: gliding motility-associated C-terminal domain-containing protein [Saprospiraceae bacterium]|nr:gliding motility-associated C-terminal domain-containing protein [Saprospiraceae bacterium]